MYTKGVQNTHLIKNQRKRNAKKINYVRHRQHAFPKKNKGAKISPFFPFSLCVVTKRLHAWHSNRPTHRFICSKFLVCATSGAQSCGSSQSRASAGRHNLHSKIKQLLLFFFVFQQRLSYNETMLAFGMLFCIARSRDTVRDFAVI